MEAWQRFDVADYVILTNDLPLRRVFRAPPRLLASFVRSVVRHSTPGWDERKLENRAFRSRSEESSLVISRTNQNLGGGGASVRNTP